VHLDKKRFYEKQSLESYQRYEMVMEEIAKVTFRWYDMGLNDRVQF
jgi:hypothetical protein